MDSKLQLILSISGSSTVAAPPSSQLPAIGQGALQMQITEAMVGKKDLILQVSGIGALITNCCF